MSHDPNACGACSGTDVETPAPKRNVPGQAALNYRVGTQAQFLDSLLARLSGGDFPALAKLTARTPDDPAIALCDAAATMADVLAFYQERIVNESFLRTATERRSLIELANLVGYAPAPGVAADVCLAFETEQALSADAPPVLPVPIPAGARVQSVPGANEKPQTFETVEAIVARPEFNAIRPQLDEPQAMFIGQLDLFLSGAATVLAVGDAVLIVGAERLSNLGSERWDVRTVAAVELDPLSRYTRVRFTEPLGSASPKVAPAGDAVRVYALRQRASLFGHNAPDPLTLPLLASGAASSGTSSSGSSSSTSTANVGLISNIPPAVTTVAAAQKSLLTVDGQWLDFLVDFASTQFDLDAAYPRIVAGSWAVLIDGAGYAELYGVRTVSQLSRANFGISTKVTRLGLEGENFDKFSDRRTVQVLAQSEELRLHARPLSAPVGGSVVALDGLYRELRPGRWLAFAGSTVQGAAAAEIARIDEASDAIAHDALRTTIRLDAPLVNAYARAGLRICANVARATHGETVSEIAGSGRAAQPDQRFALRQAPLTYVSSARPEGCEPTLEVRVNDLRWNPVSRLYAQAGDARVYRIEHDDDGRSAIQFGDGVEGARLPTGQDNVRLRYRKGLGVAGNVRAGSLTTLLTRPLGLKGVRNPVAASGGADAESREQVRSNAPISVLTLGRAVSVRDYADFARSFAGIAKSHALWIPYGASRGMHLTVAGPDGAEIPAGSRKLADLIAALRAYGDPLLPLTVQTYRRAEFEVRAKIRVAADAQAERVLDAVRAAVRARFSFDARAFGQPVSLSELMACMQNCAGVVAVDVDRLRRLSPQPGYAALTSFFSAQPPARLPAFLPRPDASGAVSAAELLLPDRDAPQLVVMP